LKYSNKAFATDLYLRMYFQTLTVQHLRRWNNCFTT